MPGGVAAPPPALGATQKKPTERYDWPEIKRKGKGDTFCNNAAKDVFGPIKFPDITGPRLRTALDLLADGKPLDGYAPEEAKIIGEFVSWFNVDLNGTRPKKALPAGPPAPSGWPALPPVTEPGPVRRAPPARGAPAPRPAPVMTAPAAPPEASDEPSETDAAPRFGSMPSIAEVGGDEAGSDAQSEAGRTGATEYEAMFTLAVTLALRNSRSMGYGRALVDVIRSVDGGSLSLTDFERIVTAVYAGRKEHQHIGPDFDGPVGDYKRPEDL